ncbi:unnamed protein product [Clonostachys rhizophaga]|uniref:Uncharacterized protein n=1 Tax=Clonostachys rhizophaga TaxID=160324 RepID=A0A9N9VNT3_9HYPO|nr:unnamed protein product [Clonostachys rhizophaga]
MALLYQHATNLSFNTAPIVFKNDDNNVSALENARLQKKRMEEAARLQKQQLEEAAVKLQKQVEDTEEVIKERDHLRSENKLYFPNNTVGLDVHVGNAPGKQCYWYIGRASSNRVGSWVIKNAEWGTCIQMGNGGKENARHVYSYPVSDHADANWLMVPLSFN